MTFQKKPATKIVRVKFREYITPPNTEHRVDMLRVTDGVEVVKGPLGLDVTIGGKTEFYPWCVVRQVRSVVVEAKGEAKGEPDAEA